LRQISGPLGGVELHAVLRVHVTFREHLELAVEFVGAERSPVERRTTAAGAVEREMDPRLAELRADSVLLKRVETHLLAGDRDAFAGKESEERVLHAFRRIFAERFMQDPGVIRVDVKSELLLFPQR